MCSNLSIFHATGLVFQNTFFMYMLCFHTLVLIKVSLELPCRLSYRHTKSKHIRWITLDGRHELSLTPAGGSTKAPTGESSATSLPWIKKPLKVGLLPAAERVTIEVKKEMWPQSHIEPTNSPSGPIISLQSVTSS